MILITAAVLAHSVPIENGAVLRPFFAKLAKGEFTHIIQIGDSHTAGDAVSGGLRDRLQAQFGNGGRGVMAAGRPYAGFVSHDVTTSQRMGWVATSLFGPAWTPGGPALGLSGFTQTARAAGEWVAVSADTPDLGFSRVTLCGLTGPAAGLVQLNAGADSVTWSFTTPVPAVKCFNHRQSKASLWASVTTLTDAPVSLTSFATLRSGGVALSNLGVTGAQLSHFGRTDDGVIAGELASYRPDLIIIAFGTNEGFSPRFETGSVKAALRSQVARLRRFVSAPILVLGAPDSATRNPALAAPMPCGDGWSSPKFAQTVRTEQREAARELGLAYWDWAAAMGGTCQTNRWFSAGLMRADHVHFTRAGGDRIGALLFADLMAAR